MIPTTLTTASSLSSSSVIMILNNNSNNINNNNSNSCNSNSSNNSNNCGLNKCSPELLTGRGNNSIHANTITTNNNNNNINNNSNNGNSNNISNSNNLHTVVNSFNNSNNISTISNTCMANSTLLGIASLILEGRAYSSEDDNSDGTITGSNNGNLVRHELALNTSAAVVGIGSGKGEGLLMGRQSPKPSTSRSSIMEKYHHHHHQKQQEKNQQKEINAYFVRKLANSPDIPPCYAKDAYNSSNSISTSCSSSSSSSDESGSVSSAASSYKSNQSRWSEKLSQLRQESPSTFDSKGVGVVTATAEEKVIAVERPRANESEYVTLKTVKAAAKDDSDDEDITIEKDADFEIIRRVPTNRVNYYNNTKSSNLMQSLSAANSGSITTDDHHHHHLHHSHLSGGNNRVNSGTSLNSPLAFSNSLALTVTSSAVTSNTVSGGLSSLQSLATNTCLRVRTFNASTPKYAAGYKIQPSSNLSDQLGCFQSSSSTSCSIGLTSSFSEQSLVDISSSSTAITADNALASSRKSKHWLNGATTTSEKLVSLKNNNASNNKSATTTSFDKSVGNTADASVKMKNVGEKKIVDGSVDSNKKSELSSSCDSANARTRQSSNHPQQGPHCVQFLRKMGLMSAIAAGDLEEHSCDISFVNLICTRWRAYCIKMETILEQGEPICIEVYLGPSNQRILLEQWIITIRNKQPPPTMTLPSLCSAIRSQLYFSQISAWCDLIKKADKSILETGRLITDTVATTLNSAAGDLATTTSASSSLTAANASVGGNILKKNVTGASTTELSTPLSSVTTTTTTLSSMTPKMSTPGTTSLLTTTASASPTTLGSQLSSRRIRLNIFYRIKQYDSTACFNSKPNVHNFPNVNITENCCISVCLKSLPRISGGLPPKLEQLNVNQAVRTSKISMVNKSNGGESGNSKQHQRLLRQLQQKPLRNLGKMVNSNISNISNNDKTEQSQDCNRLGVKGDIKISSFDTNMEPLSSSLTAGISSVFATTAAVIAAAATKLPVATDTNILNASNQKKKKLRVESRLKTDSQQQQNQQHQQTLTSSTSSLLLPSSSTSNWYNEQQQSVSNSGIYQQSHIKTKDVGNGDGINNGINIVSTKNVKENNDEFDDILKVCDMKKVKGQYRNCIPINSSPSGQNFRKRVLKSDMEVFSNNYSLQRYQINPLSTVQLMDHDNNKDEVGIDYKERVNNEDNNKKDGKEKSIVKGLGEKSLDCTDQREQSMSALYTSKNVTLHLGSDHECIERVGPKEKENFVQQQIKMISTGTQTVITPSGNLSNNCCIVCGNVRTLLCVQCGSVRKSLDSGTIESMGGDDSGIDNRMSINETMDLEDNTSINLISEEEKLDVHLMDTKNSKSEEDSLSTCSFSSIDIIHTPRNKAELLLQAIQRTAKINSKKSRKGNGRSTTVGQGVTSKAEFQSNNNSTLSGDCENEDVQMSPIVPYLSFSSNILSPQSNHIQNIELDGKRSDSESGFNAIIDINNDKDDVNLSNCQGCKRQKTQHNFKQTTTTTTDSTQITPTSISLDKETVELDSVDQECYISSTKLTPHLERCSLKNRKTGRNSNYNSDDEDNANESGISGILLTAHGPLGIIEKTEKEYLLRSNLHPLLLRRQNLQPKVNLTPLLCNTSPQWMETGSSSPAYVPEGPIKKDLPSFVFEPAPVIVKTNFNSSPVTQKSNISSPSISARFLKPSNVGGIGIHAFQKRRSRHLSDRCANDDTFSDDEIEESGVGASCSASSCSSSNSSNCSPTALKARGGYMGGLVGSGNGSYFRYSMLSRTLLGNLEENLLQRRLPPKIEVSGYKLLLGASGGFCPTQLTLPATAYFYELQGEHLFTPYLCEVRLPRKGYTVPRFGTIQATLLNPMGTVVRMFMIPYDLRDMPALHQTFVRQRIRADNDSHNSNKNSNFENTNVNKKNQHQYNSAANDKSHLHSQQRTQAKSLRYSIHLRFQTSRSGRLMLHSDVRVLISRRTDCDTAAAHAKGILEAPNELIIDNIMPEEPKYSARLDQQQQQQQQHHHPDEILFSAPAVSPAVSTIFHKM